jgi:tetratricopeptide (TPR) repeat protein
MGMGSGNKTTGAQKRRAVKSNQEGLDLYAAWELEEAVQCFSAAAAADPDNAEYHLNLARALARGGDYENAIRALGDYIRTERDPRLAERYEKLFASALDEVETTLIDRMRAAKMDLSVIGAAIQMWLEYRIAIGRQQLTVRKPETWAAALDYTVRKINFHHVVRRDLADYYGISDGALRARHDDLVQTLDIMPADYRYFTGEDNPLDKLVEAAQMLEQLEARFREA